MNAENLMANISVIKIANGIPQAFSNFTWADGLDIIIASFFIYVLLVFIKQTRSYFILNTLGSLLIVSYISQALGLDLTQRLFQPILTFFLVIFVIVFQREIRRFFRWFAFSGRRFGKTAANLGSEISGIIVHAVQDMAKVKMGSLIVLSGDYPLDDIIEGGFLLDGEISSPLILSIFDHTTPGHDGAMIIESKRIKKFGVHLPLAENFKGFAVMGTRHRAAIGISEKTDALAIVVSEEKGTISVAEGGKIRTLQNAGELDDVIKKFLKENNSDTDVDQRISIWKYLLVHDLYSKIIAVGAALVLWLVFTSHVS